MEDLLYWQNEFEIYLSKAPNADGSHDISHSRRVWNLAKRFGSKNDDELTLLAACYFHDLVSYPKNHPNRSQSSKESAIKARAALMEMGFPNEKLGNVCHCIEAHSFSANIETQTNEARIVQDADRIEALGAIGLARTFHVAGQNGLNLFCSEDPFANQRELNDKRFAIDHFESKLLKLPSTMKTEKGKREAEKRADLLRRYLVDLRLELTTLNSN